MNMAPPDDILSSASTAQAHDPETDRSARNHDLRMAALEAIIADGLTILDEIKRRALRASHEVEEESKGEPDLGLAFDRISRAIRFTVAQHERLEIDAAKTIEQRQAEAAARQAAEAQRAAKAANASSPEERAAKHEQERKLRLVERAVRRAIDNIEDYDERDERLEDLNERLEEVEDLGLNRPVGAVVASICRAMRLPFDFALWEDEPWALSEAAEQTEGSPYAKRRRSADYGRDEPCLAPARRGVGPP